MNHMHNKQYQNVSIQQLFEWAEMNPNRGKSLTPIEVHVQQKDDTHSLKELHLPSYKAETLNPCGIISVIAYITDLMYTHALPNVRNTMLREFVTELQQMTDNLSGTSLARKRRKIYEWIAIAFNGGQLKDDEWLDLYSALAIMNKLQLILVKRPTPQEIEMNSGSIGEVFFTSNPMTWSESNPTWIVDYRGHWVAQVNDYDNKPLTKRMAMWISSMETTGWKIHWSSIDGKKEEIVDQLIYTDGWDVSKTKLKKEVLSVMLGRVKAIEVFTNWANEKFEEA